MPIFLRVINGGNIFAGRIEGEGEKYVSDDNGNGEIFAGSFVRGKLECVDGNYTTYTDTGFNVYLGNFISGRLDGSVTLYTYINTTPETPEEKAVDGNCPSRTHNRRFIYASTSLGIGSVLLGRKITRIYNNGVLSGTTSDDPVSMTIDVSQRIFNTRKIFDQFIITEL